MCVVGRWYNPAWIRLQRESLVGRTQANPRYCWRIPIIIIIIILFFKIIIIIFIIIFIIIILFYFFLFLASASTKPAG